MSPKPELEYVLLADRMGLPLALSRTQEGGKASQERKLSKAALLGTSPLPRKFPFRHTILYVFQ